VDSKSWVAHPPPLWFLFFLFWLISEPIGYRLVRIKTRWPIKWSNNIFVTDKFPPVKSVRLSELILGILLFEFRFTLFFPLGCGVNSWITPLQFFQTAKGKAPKETWGGRLSGGGINVAFLRLHEPQLSAMCCVALNQIDPNYVICIRSFVVLCPHYSTLSSPLPFRSDSDKIFRKGRFFQSFALIGFIRKLFQV